MSPSGAIRCEPMCVGATNRNLAEQVRSLSRGPTIDWRDCDHRPARAAGVPLPWITFGVLQ